VKLGKRRFSTVASALRHGSVEVGVERQRVGGGRGGRGGRERGKSKAL
jgi:hypothetical protein